MKDLHNNIKAVSLIDPIVANNDTEGTPASGLDTRGFQSAELIATLGAAADTLASGSLYWDIVLEESDDDSTWTAVTSANDVLVAANSNVAAPDANGIIATVSAAADDNKVYRVGYTGSKRYCRIKFDATGTHTNGTVLALMGILSHALGLPATD